MLTATRQVEFGLVTDAAGRPVAVEVVPGDTADPATVPAVIRAADAGVPEEGWVLPLESPTDFLELALLVLLTEDLQHVFGHLGEVELRVPAPVLAGGAVVHRVRPGVDSKCFLVRHWPERHWPGFEHARLACAGAPEAVELVVADHLEEHSDGPQQAACNIKRPG